MLTDHDHNSLASRAGGRWLISLVGFCIIALGSLLGVLTREQVTAPSSIDTLMWLTFSFIGVSGTGVVLLVANHLPPYNNRRVEPVSFVAVIFLILLSAMPLILIQRLFPYALDVKPASWVFAGVATDLIVVIPLALAIILTLDYWSRLRILRKELRMMQVRSSMTRAQQSILATEAAQEITAAIESDINSVRPEIYTRINAVKADANPESVAELALSLRTLATDVIRPLSSRMWTEAHTSLETPSSNPMRVFSNIRLQPLLLVTIYVVGNTSSLVETFGPTQAVAMMALSSFWVVLISAIGNSAGERWPNWHGLIFGLSVLALQLPVIVMAAWRDSLVPGTGSTSWVVTQVAAGLVLIALSSGFESWTRTRTAIVSESMTELEAEHVRAIAQAELLGRVSRDAARILHGTMQTKLVACAMVSERAVRSNDPELLELALAEIEELLVNPVLIDVDSSHSMSGSTESVREKILRGIEPWEEICEFELVVDSHVMEPDSGSIAHVVEEGVANAIRHGRATFVRIEISNDSANANHVLICIDDNGIGPAQRRAGTGSAILTYATAGKWRLERTGNGARLMAVIAP